MVDAPIWSLTEGPTAPQPRWFPPPKSGTYLADPFGITRDGRRFVLCEEFFYLPDKGVISCIEVREDGSPTPPKIVLRGPFHLSYPYVVEHRGEVYCVPEAFRSREISLYRAVEFPHEWVKAETLVRNFAGVDPTLFSHNGRWWLACTNEEDGPFHKLRLWHAPDLFGPWEPHAKDPAKTDFRSARPAGTPFAYSGALFRPAQDSSMTYGGRVVINRITRLTTTEFEEEPTAIIDPSADGPYPDGIHTISSLGGATLVDGKRFAFVWRALGHMIKRGLAGRLSR